MTDCFFPLAYDPDVEQARDPYRDLLAAVVLRAVRDAKRGDAGAQRWLAGDCAAGWLALLDIRQADALEALGIGKSR